MRITMILMISLYIPLIAEAGWFCKEASSERVGSVINACGVAIGKTENEARTLAFDNAKNEFKKICSLNTDCANKEVTVSPERTSCEEALGGYKCYRMVEFKVGSKVIGPENMPVELRAISKVKRGMTIKEVVEIFGEPYSIQSRFITLNDKWKQMFFLNEKICVFSGSICSVLFKNGKVDSVLDVQYSRQDIE